MTCIVGMIDGDKTYIGGDSAGIAGYSKTIRKDMKIFKLQDNPNAVMGYTSSFRMGQLLMYANDLINEFDVNHKYLVNNFVPKIIKLFEDGGYYKTTDGVKRGGVFLLGYKNKLYKIESDYQVGESMDNYDSCGCGEEFALGSFASTENLNLSPVERMHIALRVAYKFSSGVAPPFYVMNTKNSEVIKFDD